MRAHRRRSDGPGVHTEAREHLSLSETFRNYRCDASVGWERYSCPDSPGGTAVAREMSVQRATLSAIAKEAGVSVPTVSKVVNGRTDVAPETRSRIETLLVSHGYVARGAGGVQPATRAVALVFDAMQTTNNLEILRGALEAASAESIDVVVDVVPDDPLGAAWAGQMAAARREGMILVTSSINSQQWRHFVEQQIRIVTIDPVNLPSADLPSVGAT